MNKGDHVKTPLGSGWIHHFLINNKVIVRFYNTYTVFDKDELQLL